MLSTIQTLSVSVRVAIGVNEIIIVSISCKKNKDSEKQDSLALSPPPSLPFKHLLYSYQNNI